MTQQLYVDKATGTFADQLTAFGLAAVGVEVLRRAHGDQRLSATIYDDGGYYRVELDAPLDDGTLSRFRGPYTPIVAIVTRKNADKMPIDLPEASRVDYEQQRNARNLFFQILRKLSPQARRAWRSGQVEEHPETEPLRGLEPHRDWDVFRAVNPAALIGYNKLALQWWQVQGGLPEVLALIRDLFASTPNDLEAALQAWQTLAKSHGWDISPELTAQQLYNPSQGKGQNRTKADRLSMGNLRSFWLVEWLKAVGFYRAALTKVLRGTRDRKTYVLAPLELSLLAHGEVFKRFRGSMSRSETAIRSDILASLRYAQSLLEYAVSDEGADMLQALFTARRPNRLVAGFGSAFYKNLGNAVATMNLAFIGLPGWLAVETRQDAVDMQNLLDEHQGIVRQFDETHSDQHSLLLAYRDFCSGDDLVAFFDFAVAYSAFIIGRRERNQYARQFSQDNLRRLIMVSDPKLKPILDTPGFQNIAYAIRQSTVVAQFRKSQGDRRYDVRYGLGRQLARKAHYPEEFIAELSGFLQSYNAENAQVMENREGPYRRSIQVGDIDDMVRLIDQHGSRVVCSLLIAYGYARSGAARHSEEEAPEEQ